MNILNCTPHAIVWQNEKGERVTFSPIGIIPRVETLEIASTPVWGVPVVERTTGEVQGLPEQIEGTFIIVSSMVLSASDRTDLVAPDTGATAIRNNGNIEAVTRFVRNVR